MAQGNLIDVKELKPFFRTTRDEELPTFRNAKAGFERDYVARALRITSGNVAAAARLAAKDRKDFYELMKKSTKSTPTISETKSVPRRLFPPKGMPRTVRN